MKKILDIGNYYVSNFLDKGEVNNENQYSLDLYLDETIGAPRLKEIVPPNKMYGKYWYRSGINSSMTQQLRQIVDEIITRTSFKSGDIWLDIACNDGTMFKFIPNEFVKVGIDPADDSYYTESSKHAVVSQDYFSKQTFYSMNNSAFNGKKVKIITCIAMFYDLDNPKEFLKDVYDILDDDGVFVMQMSYTPLMVQQLAFDNICHEHVYYYSLTDITKLLNGAGLSVVDCSLNETNGGSFKIYATKTENKHNFSTQPVRDVCGVRTQSIYDWELKNYRPTDEKFWKEFKARIESLKLETVSFIKQEVSKGKTVYGYGASTKGNTLLQYFDLDSSLITAIAERSPYKFGKVTVGTNIPIISEEEMRSRKPDYLLILPWHFISEFIERERDLLDSGTKFIVPCPKFNVVEK